MAAFELNQRSLKRGAALLLGLVILNAGACSLDETREMELGTPQAGSSGKGGSHTNGGSDNQPSAGEGGEPMSSGGSHASGGGGKGGTSAGGAAGKGGKGGTGPASPCGNNVIDDGEECDDGNSVSGDGCSADCQKTCEECEKAAGTDDLFLALIGADLYKDCYNQDDIAIGGPADGAPRAELCADVIDCVREHGCARFFGEPNSDPIATASRGVSIHECWCTDVTHGDDGVSLSQPQTSCYDDKTLHPGPCYQIFQAASERDDPLGISVAYIDSGTGLGRAATLLTQTDPWACPKACPSTLFETGNGGSGGGGGTAGTGGGGSGGGGSGGGGASSGGGGSGGSGGGGSGGTGANLCGNGDLDAGEGCEPPSTETCSDDCKRVVNDSCLTCENDSVCAEVVFACVDFEGAQRTQCFDVMECVRNTGCGTGAKTLTSCFCGNAVTKDCIAAATASGVCADVIRAGIGPGATNSDVMKGYLDATYPTGAAMQRLNCQKNNLPGSLCNCGL